jgi:hypothetical protein
LRSKLREVTEAALRRLSEQHQRLTMRLKGEEGRSHPRMTVVLKLEAQLRIIDNKLVEWGLDFGLPKPTSERVLDPAETALMIAQREAIKPLTFQEWDARYGVKPGEPEPSPANPQLEAKMREIAATAKPKAKPEDPMAKLDRLMLVRMIGEPLN